MKTNIMIAVHLRETILLNTITKIENAEDIDTARRFLNYALGAADAIIEMSNVVGDDDDSEMVCYYGLKTKYDALSAMAITAHRLNENEIFFKAAAMRDEAHAELSEMTNDAF